MGTKEEGKVTYAARYTYKATLSVALYVYRWYKTRITF